MSRCPMTLPESILDEYLIGHTVQELSAIHGYDYRTIKNFLIHSGIEPRGRGAQQEGEQNPNWKGGISYSTIQRRAKLTAICLGINQYLCQECGKPSKTRLNLHHKDNNRLNNFSNIEILCPSCHAKRHPKERDEFGRFTCR